MEKKESITCTCLIYFSYTGYYTKTAKKLKLSKSQFDRTAFSDTNEEEDNVPQRSSPLTLLIGVEPGSSFHNTDQLNTSVSEVQSIFEKAYAARIMTLLLEVREQNNKILSTVSKQATNITDYLLPELPVNLPVQNEEGLNVLCEYLSCKDNVESLAKYLSSVGGSNLGNKINNILKRCLSNEVARNYNFRGRREGKRAFQDLPLKDVVIRAAKLGHPNSTENDIENCIKAWLKHAPQRYKIKEHRLEKLTKF